MTHFYFISYKLQHRYVLDSVKLMTRKNKYWYHFDLSSLNHQSYYPTIIQRTPTTLAIFILLLRDLRALLLQL